MQHVHAYQFIQNVSLYTCLLYVLPYVILIAIAPNAENQLGRDGYRAASDACTTQDALWLTQAT